MTRHQHLADWVTQVAALDDGIEREIGIDVNSDQDDEP